MKKRVTKKVVVKKSVDKKVSAKKVTLPVKKTVKKVMKKSAKKESNPLNSKSAIADLRKQYAALAKLNIQRAIVLEEISKKEAALAEVLDLNMAKVDDKSNEDLLKKLTPPKAKTVTDPTDLSIKTVSAPFHGGLSPTLGALESLNAVARKF